MPWHVLVACRGSSVGAARRAVCGELCCLRVYRVRLPRQLQMSLQQYTSIQRRARYGSPSLTAVACFAPAQSSTLTTCKWPFRAALCSGVKPSSCGQVHMQWQWKWWRRCNLATSGQQWHLCLLAVMYIGGAMLHAQGQSTCYCAASHPN